MQIFERLWKLRFCKVIKHAMVRTGQYFEISNISSRVN